jgi:N-acetylneuraminic acid mutarotase
VGGAMIEDRKFTRKCEMYDWIKDEWTEKAPLKEHRANPSVITINDTTVFCFGGYDKNRNTDTIERYTYSANIWETLNVKLECGM